MKRNIFVLILISLLLLVASGCSMQQAAAADGVAAVADNSLPAASSDEASADEETIVRPEGWSEETHSNDAEPNYEVVFPQDEVNQITITIEPENWEAMQANMTELSGEQSRNQKEGGQGGGDFTSENPMWVEATIEFEGDTWTNVGVRYKGNSSLRSSWQGGSLNPPFKIDFDEFEDDYPEIKNQRFYGFKQLSLANSFGDDTYMRNTITYDLLEEAGLVSAETAYYEVILDYGDGAVSLGLYTMVEVIDDTVIERHFGDDEGNIYEADGRAASLAKGTVDGIEGSFLKENNKDEADYSDIETLYNVLHSETRITDAEAWRAELESTFDVDTFLEWLSISAVIQHWDTYGSMTHNFYLYNNPDTGQLTWISWDHNEILNVTAGGDRNNAADAPPAKNRQPAGRIGGPGGDKSKTVSLDKVDVGDNWPLIRYMLDDSIYYERYLAYLEETATNLFDADELAETYRQQAELLAPYIATEDQSAFETAVQSLTEATYERAETVADFLKQ